MPYIDVSSLLSDLDIAGQTFSVIRSASTSSGGITVLTPTQTDGLVGSVQPASSQELLRMPDGERIGGAITVRTTFLLTSGDATHTADIVVYKSVRYTVQSVQDWSDFGAGYVEALCSKLDMR